MTSAFHDRQKTPQLQEEPIQRANDNSDYNEIGNETLCLKNMQNRTEADEASLNEKLRCTIEFQDFVQSQSTQIETFDEKLVKRPIKKYYRLSLLFYSQSRAAYKLE